MYSILIIVPTLNSYELLDKLLISIEKQIYKNWRLVFIDGGSCKEHISYLENICRSNNKFEWFPQNKDKKYIFGAMNQGFNMAKKNEWTLFLGSDDWLFSEDSLEIFARKINKYQNQINSPDLLIGEAIYADHKTEKLGRISRFLPISNFRRALFLGGAPPHQSTLFGPNARNFLSKYSEEFTLTADLDYFLKISLKKDFKFKLINKKIICLGEGGISGRNTLERLKQVFFCYKREFKFFVLIPIILRYSCRIFYYFKHRGITF